MDLSAVLEELHPGVRYAGHPDSPHGPDNGRVWETPDGVVKVFGTGAVCGARPKVTEWAAERGLRLSELQRDLILLGVAQRTGLGAKMHSPANTVAVDAATVEVLADLDGRLARMP